MGSPNLKAMSQAPERLLSRPRHVFDLALVVALLAELATIEELGLDLFQGQSTAGGVFRPRHIGAMKIAGINRIIVKLFKRLDSDTLIALALASVRLLPLHRCVLVLVILRDAAKELRGIRINTTLS